MVAWVSAAPLLASVGCGPRNRCEVGACPDGTVCELDGTCRALADSDGSRFARATRRDAVDWASTVAGARESDELPVGDGAEAFFAFDVPRGEVVHAVLSVHFVSSTYTTEPVEARVFLVSELDGEIADRGVPPRRIGPIEVGRVIRPGASRPVHLDVSRAIARAGLGTEGGRVSFGVALEGPRHALASPRAVELATRPHLDLRLR